MLGLSRGRLRWERGGFGEEIRRREFPGRAVENSGDGVQAAQRDGQFRKARPPFSARQKVALHHDQTIGERDLTRALGPRRGGRRAVDRIDHRCHASERKPPRKGLIGEKGMKNRRRLGEPGRLQDDPRKERQRPASRRSRASCRASIRSPRSAQQTQPPLMRIASPARRS